MIVIYVLVVVALLTAMIVGWESYQGYYHRCDHRIFTVHITEADPYSTTSQMYVGTGVYDYPPAQAGQKLKFETVFPFQVGEYLDQCINLNLNRVDTNPNDSND